MNKRISIIAVIAICISIAVAQPAGAVLVDLGPGSFSPLAPVITFSEYAGGTQNPVYNFTGLAGIGDITVSFGGNFVGQTAGGSYPVTLTDHSPSGPLALDPNAPKTFITGDGSNPTSPILSGSPLYSGPISVLFSKPVAGVALTGGWFNVIGSTSIEAYDANGTILGSIVNTKGGEWDYEGTGLEFYGLADSTGTNIISGISFFITGNEPAGFGIDNLTFGYSDVIVDPDVNHSVPEPASMLLFGAGLAGVGIFRRKFRA